MSIFSVGTGALNAAQVGILTTSHNIANSSTPGYNRQAIIQGTNFANRTGAGYIGAGTNVQTVRRIYDDFLSRQILNAEAGAAEMAAYRTQIDQIDNLLADPDAGLSPAMADFFKGVQEVAANPASIPGRQAMLSAAQSLVARFQGIDTRLRESRQAVNSQIQGQVGAINTFAVQLAEINAQIILAEAGSQSQVPNDLYDQRDKMIRDMNQLVRVTTVKQSDGSFNVFIGQGQSLVIGSQAYGLQAVADPADPERYVVALSGGGGAPLTLPDSQITGGSLGGLIAFRNATLDEAQNSLGRVAITLAQNFNDQHRLGVDLTGDLGGDLFVRSNPGVSGSALNTGFGAPTVTFDLPTLTQLSASDYRVFSPDGVQLQMIRLSDNQAVIPLGPIPGAPVILDGLSFDFTTWTPAANDSFTIQPTRAGAGTLGVAISDPRAIAAAAPIRTSAPVSNSGTGSIDAGLMIDAANPAFANFNATGQLTPPIMIQFDTATSYTIWDMTTPAFPVQVPGGPFTYTPGANVLYPGPNPAVPDPTLPDYGYQIKVSGAPAVGDRFLVNGNLNGVADNRNAQRLGALQTASTMLGGATFGATASYQSAYSQIVSGIGTKAREVTTIGDAQQGLADYATTTLQEISGVNLDEEAANLLRFQQAYQAAAKILATATTVFEEVLALGR